MKRAKKESSFYHLKIKKDYLNRTQETITKKGKTKKSGYIKNKNIFLSWFTINKMKKAREWEVIFVMNKTGKGLVSRTYKELLQINNKITT